MAYPRSGWRAPYRQAYQPFSELAALRREMSRMLAALSGGRGDPGALADIEMDQDEQGWTVTARLPGVAPEEVQIEVEDRELCIQVLGETEEGGPAEGGQAEGGQAESGQAESGQAESGQERQRSVAFDYRIALPGEVDPEKVEATMDHGLLTVSLPRSARSARRKITIGRSSLG